MAGTQIGGTGCGLPVVEMNNIGREAKPWQRIEQAATEEQEAPLLIALVQAEINALLPAKKLWLLEQIDRHRGTGKLRLQNRDRAFAAGHRQRECHARRLQTPVIGID